MSTETCPTVRVVSPSSPGGYKVINESDLTPEDDIWDGNKQDARERVSAGDHANPAANKQTAPDLNLNSPTPSKKSR